MDSIMGIYYFAWSFIFNRAFLIENHLYFQKNLYYEDSEFAYRFLPIINKIKLFNKECYIYNIRQGSITQSISEKKIDDLLYIAEKALTIYNNTFPKECFLRSATNILITAILHSISIEYNYGITQSKNLIKNQRIKRLALCGSYPTRIIAYIYNTIGLNGALFITHFFLLDKKDQKIITTHYYIYEL